MSLSFRSLQICVTIGDREISLYDSIVLSGTLEIIGGTQWNTPSAN